MFFGAARGLAHTGTAAQSDVVPCQLNYECFLWGKTARPYSPVFNEATSTLKHIK